VAVDSVGNLYIADAANYVVRRVDAGSGVISTVAGGGHCGLPGCGDGGPATQAALDIPVSVALDLSGNLYIDDSYGHAVREVSAGTGLIRRVAGTGDQDLGLCRGGYSGDGGPATQAQLYCPHSVTVDSQGNVFIADQDTAVVREVLAGSGTIVTIAGGGTGGDGSLATQASVTAQTLAVDGADNLYIGGNQAAVKVIGAPGGPWPVTPSSGLLPWRPHRGVRLAAGLAASVDLADGHLTLTTSGMHLPGQHVDLAFDRTYDTAGATLQPGATTPGWTNTAMPTIGGVVTGTIVYTDDTGATWPFTFAGGPAATAPYTTYTSPPSLPWQLSVAVAPSTAYTLSNILTGATRTFNAQGALLSDADAYGNNNSVSYGSSGPLTTTNSGGRVLRFSYRSGLLSDIRSTASSGQHVAYTYSGNQRNEVATLARGVGTTDVVTSTFGYTSASELGTITTGAGRIWTIGYDLYRRVASITSPTSGTIPAYTTQFTYTPGQTQVVEGYGSPAPVTTTYTLDGQGEATAVQDALGHTSTASYDQDHDIVTSTDALSNTTAYSYTYVGPNQSVGLLTQRVDPPTAAYTTGSSLQSSITTYKYNANNDLTEVDAPAGGITLYGYDGARHAVITTTQLLQSNPGGGGACPQIALRTTTPQMRSNTLRTNSSCVSNQWRASVNLLDQYGEITGTVDGRGVDVGGNITPTVTLDPVHAPLVMRHYAYDPQGDLVSVSTPPLTTALGGVLRANQPVTTTYGYDIDGDLTAITSINGATTTLTYDGLGRVVTTTAPAVKLYDGSTQTPSTTISYDGDGNVVSAIDALGDQTTRSYDPLERLAAQTNPLGRTALYTYTAIALAATQDYSGSVTQYTNDPLGRPVTVLDPLNVPTSYGYDAVGNTTVMTTPLSVDGIMTTTVEQRGYDALNRLATLSIQGGGAAPTSPQVSTTSYDGDGNVVLQVSPGGGATGSTYDLADRLQGTSIFTNVVANTATVALPIAGANITLDAADNATRLVDFSGQGHLATYDGANRVVQTSDCTFSCLNTPPITTTPSYDPDGNVVALTQTVGTTSTTTAASTMSYNGADWLVSQDDGQGPTQYRYDQAGRLRAESLLAVQGAVTATLNVNGLTTGLIDMGNVSPTTGVNAFTYTAADLPSVETLNSGGSAARVTQTWGYDAGNRVTNVSATGPATATAALNQSYGYTYDPQGHTLGLTYTGDNPNSSSPRTQSATYAANGSLQVVRGSGPGGTYSFTYDGNGNLLSSGAGDTYHYQESTINGTQVPTPTNWLPNELIDITYGQPGPLAYQPGGDVGFSYDNSGNPILLAAPNSASFFQAFRYDAQNRLVQVAITGTSTHTDNTIAIAYNARGLRSRYTVTRRGRTAASFDEQFLYRGGQVGQVAVTGTQVITPFSETFLYRPNGSPLELLYTPRGGPTTRYWYVLDGRGDVVALTDSTGAVVDRYYYDAWGLPTSPDGGITPSVSEKIHQPLRYRGYWFDGWDDSLGAAPDQGWNAQAAVAWYWLGRRSYDPHLRRFLQPDPSKQGSLPDYTYANNDPLDVSDPAGLDGSPSQCGSVSYNADPLQHARCNAAGYTYQRDQQNYQPLVGAANLLGVGPDQSVGERAAALFGLLPLGRVAELGADAVHGLTAAGGLETLNEGFALTNDSRPVYRVVRADEDLAQGLTAKDPTAQYTLEGHILNGSKSWFRSQFISTTTDFAYASGHAIRNNLRLVQIDLDKVVGKAYDLSTSEGRDLYLRGTTAKNYAKRASEITVEGYIPPDAVNVVQPAFAPRTYQP